MPMAPAGKRIAAAVKLASAEKHMAGSKHVLKEKAYEPDSINLLLLFQPMCQRGS
jgi:hypothetical protein